MRKTCTASDCRREFTIGPSAPVTCPYCGRVYPRIPADTGAHPVLFGYGVRIESQGQTAGEVRQIVRRITPGVKTVAYTCMTMAFLIYGEMPLREAQRLCRRFAGQGLRAEVISGREIPGSRLPVFRIRPERRRRIVP